MVTVSRCVQLRRWQQHMEEQLKGHQLEELLRLQEEHLRLLGVMNESQICTKGKKEKALERWKISFFLFHEIHT